MIVTRQVTPSNLSRLNASIRDDKIFQITGVITSLLFSPHFRGPIDENYQPFPPELPEC
jgi:hypothetical protein